MKKIIILSNHHEYTYKFRKEIIAELINAGHEVYLVLPYGKKVELLKDMGVKFINITLDRRGINPLSEVKLIKKYYQIIGDIKPDLILSYTVKPNVYGGLICKIKNIPFIPNVTGLGSSVENDNLIQKIVFLLYRITLNKSTNIFFQNEDNLKYFIENIFKPNEYRLIPGSGVNLQEHKYQDYPHKKNEINFVFMGRIMAEKGITELFEAAKYFKQKKENVNFHILGFLEDDLEEVVTDLHNQGIIIYHGFKSEVSPFLKRSHAIIHPSYHEGLSNVLLEAAASGRPILASNIPGCRETFDEGITGFGFEAKSTESLIQTIQKFIDLPHEEKEKMGILGRKKIESEFNREKVVDAYITEINKLK